MRNPNGYGGIRKLPGKRRRPWQITKTVGWSDDGKQIQKPIGYAKTRAEALLILAEYNKNPFDLSSDITFAELYEKQDFSHRSVHSQRSMQTAFRRCAPVHKMKIREIRKPHLQEIADSLVSYSPATHQEVRILWNLMFKSALEEDLIQKDYSKFVTFRSDKAKEKKLPFTEEQVLSFNDDLFILCLTGLRISEYLNLKTSDIKDGVFYVKGMKTASADRLVPMHEKVAEKVAERLTRVYLCEHNGKPVKYDYFQKNIFKPEMERLGITGHTTHDTRRTFATICSRCGMDKAIVKRILGHKLGDLTEDVYTHKDINDLKKEMAKLVL